MLTAAQIEAGHNVRRTLRAMEHAVKAHHVALAALRDSFQSDLPSGEFETFGGGTPKDDPPIP